MSNHDYAADRQAREKLLGQISSQITEIALNGGGLKELNAWIVKHRTYLVNGTPIRHRAPKPEVAAVTGLEFKGGEA
jgi:hypothetical protein